MVRLYYYGMRLRGFSPGCQPRKNFYQRVNDVTGKYWDILTYVEPLSKEEIFQYDLDYLYSEDMDKL